MESGGDSDYSRSDTSRHNELVFLLSRSASSLRQKRLYERISSASASQMGASVGCSAYTIFLRGICPMVNN